MFKIDKCELIQIPVPSGTTVLKFFFPTNDVLRDTPGKVVKIKGIEFFPAQTVPKAPDASTVMASTDLCKGFLTLYINDGEYYKMPISRMISVHNNTVTGGDVLNYAHINEIAELNNLKVNWQKSYVQWPAALAATDVAILCCVYYDYYETNR